MAQKSPRAPQLDLETALERALVVLGKEKLNEIPVDGAAKALGYKSANNGAAMSTLATLRYYGLIERTSPGKIQVSKDVQKYTVAPDQGIRRSLLSEWLYKPQIFSDLLERYGANLPSDSTPLYMLVDERGFNPAFAESVITVLRRSVEFVGVEPDAPGAPKADIAFPPESTEALRDDHAPAASAVPLPGSNASPVQHPTNVEHDRIPVRLSGGRRAWLEIPVVFLEEDKARIKAQIDTILTDEIAT